ncbi:MAG: phosphoribosyltransferase family protein [Solirubrobacterales bacterium]
MKAETTFRDRAEAGAELAQRLMSLRESDPVVVALPRGGVPVAHEVAAALEAPLDVLVVRKLGAPANPELGIGAVAEDGTGVIDHRAVRALGVSDTELREILDRETAELRRRADLYRGERAPLELAGRTVILVDDGVATGVTNTAALRAIRTRGPKQIVLAVPVCAPEVAEMLAVEADQVVALLRPPALGGVGRWYEDFSQVPDDEVLRLLHSSDGNGGPETREVTVESGEVNLPGDLFVPPDPVGTVLFAHGSGSSRHSPRNIAVARMLHRFGLATLLFDLLTPEESRDRANVFAVELLGRRLVDATRWVRAEPELDSVPLGYFGASTGAAAALIAAAQLPREVDAVVSRGGRPDLAGSALRGVDTPTLLIVGGDDTEVLRLNRQAQEMIPARCELAIVKGAGHLFEEPGTLAEAAELAGEWFKNELGIARTREAGSAV